jgi:glycosyltransferase involved in cell wall biosynthesis
MPFFSVIIPLFNKQNFITITLKSVLDQSFQDFEIIVVEDCSTDSSLKIVTTLNHDKIRIIENKTNKGLSASRNIGIKNANSKYIAFLDADDLWKTNYLQKIYDLIQRFPDADLFGTNYELIYPNNRIVLPITKIKPNDFEGIIEDFFKESLAQPIYCPSGFCVNKRIFDIIGFYNETITFGEDVDFNIRANLHFKLCFTNEPLMSYIMYSENQITNTSLKGRTITDFDFYENNYKNNFNLKKHLDFNRYIMAKQYKLEHDNFNYNLLMKKINCNPFSSSLNYKQIILLKTPVFLLNLLKFFKLFLVKKGVQVFSYD